MPIPNSATDRPATALGTTNQDVFVRRRVVVLGTGTNVGKTYVTARLARGLAHVRPTEAISAIKPIESGVEQLASNERNSTSGAKLEQSAQLADAAVLAENSQPPFSPPVSPWTFRDAVSPHLAAKRCNAVIEVERVVEWITDVETRRSNSCASTHWAIVESAGAVFSPIGPKSTNFDLASQLDPALWILVAPDRLGVLHDLTVTLLAMKARGRSPDLVVLSQAPPNDDSTGTNAVELAELRLADVAAVVSHGAELPTAFIERVGALASPRST